MFLLLLNGTFCLWPSVQNSHPTRCFCRWRTFRLFTCYFSLLHSQKSALPWGISSVWVPRKRELRSNHFGEMTWFLLSLAESRSIVGSRSREEKRNSQAMHKPNLVKCLFGIKAKRELMVTMWRTGVLLAVAGYSEVVLSQEWSWGLGCLESVRASKY